MGAAPSPAPPPPPPGFLQKMFVIVSFCLERDLTATEHISIVSRGLKQMEVMHPR